MMTEKSHMIPSSAVRNAATLSASVIRKITTSMRMGNMRSLAHPAVTTSRSQPTYRTHSPALRWVRTEKTMIRCRAFGCVIEPDTGCCARCHTWVYDYPHITVEGCWFSRWYRLRHWWFMHRFYRFHRCEVCGEGMMFTKEECCSPKCYEEWYPF